MPLTTMPVLRRRRRQSPPVASATRHIGIIAGRIVAVIPELRRQGRWRQRHPDRRRLKRIGIGIDRRRIKIPDRPDHPPPAEATAMAPVKPVAAAPLAIIALMEMTDIAMPAQAVLRPRRMRPRVAAIMHAMRSMASMLMLGQRRHGRHAGATKNQETRR